MQYFTLRKYIYILRDYEISYKTLHYSGKYPHADIFE